LLLIAEMMLRRTNAGQVATVYREFELRFGSSLALAEADDAELAALLKPLGLAWRIPAFKRTAAEIQQQHHGRVPSTRAELVALPGVGDYVAGAVLSIGYGKPEWMVDTNFVRVARRYFRLPTSREGRRDRCVIELARDYSNADDPRSANLALLDFCAALCRARQPLCAECPVLTTCPYARS
jgi:A/G-specific adenine glycosylase